MEPTRATCRTAFYGVRKYNKLVRYRDWNCAWSDCEILQTPLDWFCPQAADFQDWASRPIRARRPSWYRKSRCSRRRRPQDRSGAIDFRWPGAKGRSGCSFWPVKRRTCLRDFRRVLGQVEPDWSEVVRRCLSGESPAWTELVKAHHRPRLCSLLPLHRLWNRRRGSDPGCFP